MVHTLKITIIELQQWRKSQETLTKGTGPLTKQYTIEQWREFYKLLARHFDLNDLEDLMFRLGITSHEIPGETRSEKAREIIMYCERMVITADLIQQVRELRPTVEWP